MLIILACLLWFLFFGLGCCDFHVFLIFPVLCACLEEGDKNCVDKEMGSTGKEFGKVFIQNTVYEQGFQQNKDYQKIKNLICM